MSLVQSTKPPASLLHDPAVVLAGHKGAVLAAKFSPHGQYIASGGIDSSILLWHLPTTQRETPNYGVLTGHKGAVTSLCWRLDSLIFTTSADRTIAFWDAETGQRTRKGQGHETVVNDSCVADDICVSVADDGSARIWDERQKTEVASYSTKYPLLACSASQDCIYIAGIDAAVQAIDLRTQKLLWKSESHTDSITSLAFSTDGTMLAARAMGGLVRTVSTKSTVPAGISRMANYSYDGAIGGEQLLVRARFSSDDVYLALGLDDGSSFMWSTASRRVVRKSAGHQGPVLDLDFHPTEKILMTSSADSTIVVREY